MPRQAHGRPLQHGKVQTSTRKRPAQNRRLNALEIAEQENPDSVKIRQHRLGVVEDDSDEPHTRADLDERSSKRRKVATNDEDESVDEGSDLEGNRWHVGVDDDEEDSDIDSEDAFGASDEERFADFSFRGSASTTAQPKKNRNRSAAHDLEERERDDDDDEDEDEEEESDDLGDDAVELATAWDMDDESGSDTTGKKKKKKSTHARRGGDDEDEEDSTSDDDADSDSQSEDDDQKSLFSVSDEDGDHSRLQSFVEGLSSGRSDPASRKQRLPSNLPDRPSQFGTSGSKISAADMMQYIKDPRQRQSLKILQNNEEQGGDVYKDGIPGKLAPPLAKRQQDRLDRAAAYDETKKELGKWVETVKQNRRAEHLSFPLVDPAASGELVSKQLGPTSKSQPMTVLESTIQEIMKESGMMSKEQRSLDDQEQAYEELQEKKLPLEEVQARRAELRKARDLMFREEIRARRIKKIKSKSYRRVHRKEREKAELEHRSLLAAQGLIDSDEDREKNDRRRAEERMGARHRESKWAKSIKATGRAAWDENARHSVTDLARRDEELRRRIEGKTLGADDEIESSESEEYSDSEDERVRLQEKVQSLSHDNPVDAESRLNNMAFMKKAEASRKAANDEELRRLQRSLQDDGAQGRSEDSEADWEEPKGRRRFGVQGQVEVPRSQPSVQKGEFEEPESDAEREDDDDNGEEHMGQATQVRTSNSVITPLNSKQPQPQSLSTKGPGKAANKVTTSGRVVAKPTDQQRAPREAAIPRKQTTVPHTDLDGYTSPSESENEQDDHAALANAIFAGPDEVEQDFAKEKKEVEEEEGDQVIDNGLPGWGSWAGEGISKKAQKRAKGRSVTTVKGVSKDKRQDAKLERVIINEKRVKRNGKYLATELPHPFESRQQYERSLRLPLGPEWTTKSTFQDATKPRILTKQGIIRPMARPMV
ncbi:hypothetical protein PV08_06893 [Exophiala spinifera]|uniref:Uncharacterized protein n=1 Tax=Exophiala spinifera TaxID=91928 RepID=A0A0D1ZMR5_9EURO|nr:uncharacterized protein PV08_06893 [Exophiala spinifera]KIW14112.1 hypothetical protein PV08_06893 [Exophiala spinifera]